MGLGSPAPVCAGCCHEPGFRKPKAKVELHEPPAPALCLVVPADPWPVVLEQPWVPGFSQGHGWLPGTFCDIRASESGVAPSGLPGFWRQVFWVAPGGLCLGGVRPWPQLTVVDFMASVVCPEDSLVPSQKALLSVAHDVILM